MDVRLQQILDSLPEEEPRSRLEPYKEFILRLRRQGRSYRKIRQLLAEKCSVSVADMTLYEFVQRRSRPRKRKPELELEPLEVQPAVPATQQLLVTAPKRLSPEEREAQREVIRSLRNKAVFISERPAKPRFEYDPDKPLTIDRTIKD